MHKRTSCKHHLEMQILTRKCIEFGEKYLGLRLKPSGLGVFNLKTGWRLPRVEFRGTQLPTQPPRIRCWLEAVLGGLLVAIDPHS